MIKEFEIRVNKIKQNILSKHAFYIYGMGGVADNFCKVLKKYGIEPDGFIVSDGHKKVDVYRKKPVYEVGEVKAEIKDACVYLAMHDVSKVYEKCKACFENVYILDDTKDLCSLYALNALEYMRERKINLEDEYINVKGLQILNPFQTDWSYCWAWLVEYGDLLCPALFEDFAMIDEGPYELDEVKVEMGDIVLDCGANIGMFSAYSVFRGGQVYAFEPVPNVQKYLVRNCKNYIKDITIAPYAVSDRKGLVKFNLQEEVLTSGTLGEIQQNSDDFSLDVEMMTIDAYVEKQGIEKVDFIKADIEGAERYMLAGAEQTIKKYSPKLAICTYHLEDDPEVLEEFIHKCNPSYVVEHRWKKLFAYVPEETED